MVRRDAFDVVVVGAGAAGSVVAARLSESRSHSVLLLEAGPDVRAELPDSMRDGWGLPQIPDWGYVSEPDQQGDVQKLRRGRVVGGTSWLTRFAVRGSPADFDDWAVAGNPGWSFEDVLPYFRRLENDRDFGSDPWHGNSGPIPITRYLDVEPTEVGTAARRALEAVGFQPVDDVNRPGAVGFGPMPMNSIGGQRTTAAQAYLADGDMRGQPSLRPGAEVADVVLEGRRVRAVRLIDGTLIEAGCVVLSAGTYGSPPILMRSGIGPAEHLRSMGIPVQVDLNGVGANLADHPEVEIDCGYGGMVRAAPALHTIATLHTAGADSTGPPDVMLWLPDPYQPPGERPYFGIEAVLLKPRSRGSVRLQSADPSDPPRITLPHLEESADRARLAEAYARALEVANRREIRHLCDDGPTPALRGRELAEWISRTVYSLPHVVGTCAMGPSPDDGAVVNASGRVYGLEGLYVVDSSIIPDPQSGYPHLITIMIAERLSEAIATGLQN